MTNEEIVARIKNGHNQAEYMQMLYEQNLSLIRQICKKYSAYESMDDLLQEAYFGLYKAVQNYDSYNEVKFATYAYWWIRQGVYSYIQNYSSCLRIPPYLQQEIIKYKKCVSNYEKEKGRTPNEKEIAKMMHVTVEKVRELQGCSQPLASLDIPIGEEGGDSTLCEFIEGNENVENETVDKIIDKDTKNILMELIEAHTSEREQHILNDYYFNNKTVKQIAEEENVCTQRIHEIIKKSICKIRKSRKKLAERIEYVDSRAYQHKGVKGFNITFSSTVEDAVIAHEEEQRKYQKWMESASGKTAEQIKQYMDVMQMDFERRMQYLYEYG